MNQFPLSRRGSLFTALAMFLFADQPAMFLKNMERDVKMPDRLMKVGPTTGWTPASPRCAVRIITESVCSIVRFGSLRKVATPARVFSGSA